MRPPKPEGSSSTWAPMSQVPDTLSPPSSVSPGLWLITQRFSEIQLLSPSLPLSLFLLDSLKSRIFCPILDAPCLVLDH